MTPVQVGVGLGASPVGVNRREVVIGKDGKPMITLGRNTAGPRDPDVQVLRVSLAGHGRAHVGGVRLCHP